MAVLVGLLAAPRAVIAQAQPDEPDLVQLLSEQSYEESLAVEPGEAPPAAAPVRTGTSTAAGVRNIMAASGSGFRCLPSCNAADGRFLAVAGANLVTLSGREMSLTVSVPAGSPSFTIGIFDGDVRGADGAGVLHWDIGVASLYEYTLYADPLGDGTGMTVVEMQPGFPSIPSTSMPDNAWRDFTIATGPAAQSPSGNYFYRLSINLTAPTLTTLNAFKVRATAVVSGVALDPEDEPFSYIAPFTSAGDAQTIYPNFPSSNTPANYDGIFDFYFELPVSRSEVAVWDGDFDRGRFNGTESDTNDPDTPGVPFRPSWSTIDTLFEGVAVGVLGSTGNPPDDRNPSPANPGMFILRPPSVRYDLIAPDGQSFPNENPSGNQEWEQFKLSTNTSDSQVDHHTASIPAGIYRLRVQGVDMQNLNALLLPGRVLCVEENGEPCIPIRPFLVGDLVFSDCDPDDEGGQGPGIAGVTLELRDELGNLIATTVTDADGHYSFPAQAETYTVQVADSNFEPGGPLAGYISTTGVSKTETVIDDNVLTFDFGFCGVGSLGDRIWLDSNGDGIQDPDEAGIPDIFVELLDGDGNVLDQTITDFDGIYTFFNISAGTYTVRVAHLGLPEGLTPTADPDGVGTPHEATVDLNPGEDRTDVDFGYAPAANGSIGDRIWIDSDGDGVQDGGEPGLTGVTVRLFDGNGNLVATTTTGADGLYAFEDLAADTYTVAVDASTLPAGLAATYDLDGTGTPHAAILTLAAGDDRTDVDFGYRGTASVGDRVWYDIDGDGAQDPVESGLAGVTVQLLDGGGNVVATTTTGTDGLYSFTHLMAGTYTVRVVAATLPGEGAPTYDLDGTATPDNAVVTLAAGQTRTDADFGYRGTAALGDRVWYDIDGNGAQDAGEVGLNGVTVELLDGADNVLLTTATSGNGGYSFAGLLPGTYSVRVVAATLPGGAVATYDLDGTATLHIATATVASGQNLATVDFGYRGNASLGDRVWLDLDGDGVQDAGEPGLSNVAVELVDGAGNVLAISSTTSAGLYGFGSLLAGTYTVRVVSATLPGGMVQTYDLDGTATANAATLAVAAGDTRTDVDFGYRGTLQFGDRVWFDYDGNGAQDTGEPGLPSVTIELRDSSGSLLSTTITGANGNYSFYNLPPGTYNVTIVTSTLPGGAVPTYDLDGIATPHTTAVTLATGQSRTDVDFGYRGTASLGDRVWLDADGDGVQDAGEIGINGVTVQLLDTANNVIASATTAGNGNYTFPNLLAGIYKVRVVTSTLPSGTVQTYDLDGTGTAHVATVSVAGGQIRTDADFGYRMSTAPGTGTIGYWKTHPEAWPVATITIGGVTYTRDQAIVLLGTPSRGDKSIDLFKQLVAAKLNVIVGNNPSCIYQTIASADAWMAAHPPGSNVGGGSAAWAQASPWHTQLDNYNNGQLCAPHRN